jgi:ABC-2 type transport system ATP-binding protein
MASVEVQALDQAYGPQQVLFGVSLEVAAGCTGLLGPNGAGKSTLVRTLLAQLPLRPGRVRVVGRDPALQPLEVRQRVGYMPEADVYLPGLSGLDLVTFCGQLCGLRRVDAVGRAHEVLHYVGLGEARYRAVDGYSTGMRQRAKLAAALVHGPELLLLDEPTSGLDPGGRDAMLALVDDVSHRRGLTTLISSHILQDIERTCEAVVVLSAGRVVYSGPRAAFQRGQSRRLKVRAKSDPESLRAGLCEAGCRAERSPGAAELEVELPEGASAELIWQVARARGVQLRRVAPSAQSLEAAYEQAVAREPAPAIGRPA